MNAKQRRKYSRYINNNIFPILEDGFKNSLEGFYIYSTYSNLPAINIAFYKNRASIDISAFHLVTKYDKENTHCIRRRKIFKNRRYFIYHISEKLLMLNALKSFRRMEIKEYGFSKKPYDYGTDIPHFRLEVKDEYFYVIGKTTQVINDFLEVRRVNFKSQEDIKLCSIQTILEDPNVDLDVKKEILFNLELWQTNV